MTNSLQQKRSWRFLLAGTCLCILLGLSVHHSSLGAWLDAKYLDVHIRLLRYYFPTGVARDVVVVGIDEQTLQTFPEPMTLWHRHWGDFLRAMHAADASAVGLDIVMPDRSFNDIMPGNDQSLMTGILLAKNKRPLVLSITIDGSGKQRVLAENFSRAAGKKGLGYALFPRDIDQQVRRYDEHLADDGKQQATLVGQMIRGLKLAPQSGYIDTSLGAAFQYVPMQEVIKSYHDGDIEKLQRQFGGKPVLLGTVRPAEDRLALAVNLAGWEDNNNLVPGVLLHAQTLRAFLNQGLVQPANSAVVWCLIVLAALCWLWSFSQLGRVLAFLFFASGLLLLGMYLFRHGTYLPLSAITTTCLFAFAGRGVFDAMAHLQERRLLKSAFGNSVSPSVMDEILSGQLTPELGGTRKFVCILFSDIRGFTTRSESMTPEAGIHLLNRYFECVVEQIHANGGAVINFMGDGIMAIFGSPKPLQNPCAAGFAAAKAMQAALAQFNQSLVLEGINPIEIGVGVHAGEVVIGHMGSSNRNDYTAIGDAANVASRVEGLTKEVGYSIVCSKVIVDALPDSDGLVPLGPQPIKGHTPVEVYGWGKL